MLIQVIALGKDAIAGRVRAETLPAERQPEQHPVTQVWQEVVDVHLAGQGAMTGAPIGERAARLPWTGLHGQFGVCGGACPTTSLEPFARAFSIHIRNVVRTSGG